MNKALILITLMLSFSAMGSELIKTHDGQIARCQSSQDVYEQALGGTYRPIKIIKKKHSITVTIEFLSCISSRGSYKFVRDYAFEKRTKILTNYGDPEYTQIKLSKTRKNISLIAFNGLGELIEKAPLKKNRDGSYTTIINTEVQATDDIPPGKKSFELTVQSIFSLFDDTLKVYDSGYENLGSYRYLLPLQL